MSTYWQIACKTCGRSTDWGQTYKTQSRGKMFHKLARSAAFKRAVKSAFEVEALLDEDWDDGHGAPSVKIEIDCGPEFFPTSCFSEACGDHEFDAMCQYGEDYPCGCI